MDTDEVSPCRQSVISRPDSSVETRVCLSRMADADAFLAGMDAAFKDVEVVVTPLHQNDAAKDLKGKQMNLLNASRARYHPNSVIVNAWGQASTTNDGIRDDFDARSIVSNRSGCYCSLHSESVREHPSR